MHRKSKCVHHRMVELEMTAFTVRTRQFAQHGVYSKSPWNNQLLLLRLNCGEELQFWPEQQGLGSSNSRCSQSAKVKATLFILVVDSMVTEQTVT